MRPPRFTLPKSVESNDYIGSRCTLSKSSSISDAPSKCSYASTVYLRIKSNNQEEIIDETDYETDGSGTLFLSDIYTVLDSTTLRVVNEGTICRKFRFTRIFDSDYSQIDFFSHSVRQQVINFLQGESSTIIAHGASNSGKSYTMYGTPESPGLVPRSFELLFSTVNCTLAPWYKIAEDDRVVALDEHECAIALQEKQDTIDPRVIGKDEYRQARLSLDNSTSGLSEPEDRERCSDEFMSSVWISVAEIYNETLHDLLILDKAYRPPLRLTTGKGGSTYVNGLKYVHVTTPLEACQLLVFVQSKMRVAPTSMNTASSLSHTFLTVKLLKYLKGNVPDEVHVSTLTFCDLAGYRLLRKNVEKDARLTELRSINNSLLVLGRCLRHVHERQSVGGQAIGTIRESKLTRILQKVLTGREKLCLLVAIDTATDAFPQTLRVLRILPMAKQSNDELKARKRNVLPLRTPRSLKSSTTTSMTQSPEKLADVEPAGNETLEGQNRRLLQELEALRAATVKAHRAAAKVTRETQSEHTFVGYEALKKENESLASKLKEMECDRFNRELEIRQELADQYSAAIEQFENTWKRRAQDIEDEGRDLLKWSVNQVETFYKERIDSMMHRRKRKREDCENKADDTTLQVYESLETENAMVTSKVVVLREMIRGLKSVNQLLNKDRNESNFELASMKERLKCFFDFVRMHFPEFVVKIKNEKLELGQVDLFSRHSIDNGDLMTQNYRMGTRQHATTKMPLNNIDTGIDRPTFQSNEIVNTKEDSGIDCSCRSRKSTVVRETKHENGTQTDDPHGYDVDELDCKKLQQDYDQDRLNGKMDDLNYVIDSLQRIAHVNRTEAATFKGKLLACETKMMELKRENDRLTRMIEVGPLNHGQLSVENDRSKQLNQSLQKCLKHERLLAEFHFVYEQMEKCLANCKCDCREVKKLDGLLVILERLSRNRSEGKAEEEDTDLFRVLRLYDEFQDLKQHCRKRLSAYVETQSMLEMKFEWLSVALRNWDDQMLDLKTEILKMALASSDDGPQSSAERIVRSNSSPTLNAELAIESEESFTTESSGLDDPILDARQIQSDASDCSEVACGCCIGFKNAARQAGMSGWMKVKRSDASTNLLRRHDGVHTSHV